MIEGKIDCIVGNFDKVVDAAVGDEAGQEDFTIKGSTLFNNIAVFTLLYEQGYKKEKDAFSSLLFGERQARVSANLNSPEVWRPPNKHVHGHPTSE